MIGFIIVSVQLFACVLFVRMVRRNRLMNRHLVTSRRYQLACFEAIKAGNWDRYELLSAAATEELDRAQYYL